MAFPRWAAIAAVACLLAVPAAAVLALLAVASGAGGAAPLIAAALAACAGQDAGQPAAAQPAAQPGGSATAGSIPADYLHWYQVVGRQYNIPWTILAGIGTEESDNGQTTLPGVHSGQNGFGAAGPMQIGISGASTNTWGGAPIHPASENDGGVATDEDGDGTDNVYDPADAIAGAARYLNEHGAQANMAGAIFAYNHAGWYVAAVENYASAYAAGGYTVAKAIGTAAPAPAPGCTPATAAPSKVAAVLAWAIAAAGTMYSYGGTCTDPHGASPALRCDCSSLVQQAFAHGAGLQLPRTAEDQWKYGMAGGAQVIPLGQEQPGDVVYFPSYLGPDVIGHTGIVTDPKTMTMIAAPETGKPVGYSSYNPAGLPYGTHLFTILRYISTTGSRK